ncbi:hypothetical protein V6N13_142693 [Hibiscus sabdariffa]|uniref:Uncharacterized protein n=1 Tax=Hibiscus sabdariffa TaxID=183260 RepID=A0ABR2FF50_9ROSI
MLAAGVIQLLENMISNSNAHESAAALYLNLSCLEQAKCIIGSSTAVPFLVRLLGGETDPQCKLDALHTLYNLSTVHSNIPSLLSAGIVNGLHLLDGSSRRALMALFPSKSSASDSVRKAWDWTCEKGMESRLAWGLTSEKNNYLSITKIKFCPPISSMRRVKLWGNDGGAQGGTDTMAVAPLFFWPCSPLLCLCLFLFCPQLTLRLWMELFFPMDCPSLHCKCFRELKPYLFFATFS